MSSNVKEINFLGKSCPVPVIETKKIIEGAKSGDEFKIILGSQNGRDNVGKMLSAIGIEYTTTPKENGFELYFKIK